MDIEKILVRIKRDWVYLNGSVNIFNFVAWACLVICLVLVFLSLLRVGSILNSYSCRTVSFDTLVSKGLAVAIENSDGTFEYSLIQDPYTEKQALLEQRALNKTLSESLSYCESINSKLSEDLRTKTNEAEVFRDSAYKADILLKEKEIECEELRKKLADAIAIAKDLYPNLPEDAKNIKGYTKENISTEQDSDDKKRWRWFR